MIYNKTKWIDSKTPVNATNLNKIENAIEDLSCSNNKILESINKLKNSSIELSHTTGPSKEIAMSQWAITEAIRNLQEQIDDLIEGNDILPSKIGGGRADTSFTGILGGGGASDLDFIGSLN